MPKFGTLILTPFPFTDLSGSKLRPALVISNSLSGDDIIVAFISSNKSKNQKNLDLEVEIKSTGENGLKTDSVVKCAKIATLSKKVILGELGQLSTADKEKVRKHLKKIFKI